MTDGGAREDRDGLAAGASSGQPGGRLDDLITAVALGDERAYEVMYDQSASWVLGAALRVLRDPAQAEEVMQEVLLEVWRTASRFDRSQGSGISWLMTIAHRRAVDRVRSERSHASRELRAATATIDYDDVIEAVQASLDRERVQRCLGSLTALQRECVGLAYYSGYTYREVAELLDVPSGTVKTRMRDGLIRLRDCLGVS
ncbi:MAG TPA: ECF RNA polymerase sigma factor SigK [Streptosporangiaceae bacterium]|jgi:RNA polymerase sigma-70 factor (ECF subfamily)|nr:ECF RNA polymerase sigma factor SigK [Streptosporangiaceae bacterium]